MNEATREPNQDRHAFKGPVIHQFLHSHVVQHTSRKAESGSAGSPYESTSAKGSSGSGGQRRYQQEKSSFHPVNPGDNGSTRALAFVRRGAEPPQPTPPGEAPRIVTGGIAPQEESGGEVTGYAREGGRSDRSARRRLDLRRRGPCVGKARRRERAPTLRCGRIRDPWGKETLVDGSKGCRCSSSRHSPSDSGTWSYMLQRRSRFPGPLPVRPAVGSSGIRACGYGSPARPG